MSPSPAKSSPMSAFASLRSRVPLNNTLIVVLARSFVSGIEQSMIGVVFQPFVLSLGASMSQLGLLNSLGGFGGLIPTLAYPWGGWIADQRGRRIVLLGASLCAMGAFGMYAVAGWVGALAMLLPGIILLGISQVYQPVNAALVGEAVSARKHGSAYSLMMVVMIAPGIVVPILAGVVADRYGFEFIFPAAIFFEVIAFLVIWKYLREVRKTIPQQGGARAILDFLKRAWIPPPDMRWFFIAIAMDMFAWGMGFGIFYGLLSQEYGFTTTQLGILSSVSSITWAVTSLPLGRLVDRYGAKPVLIFSEALSPPLMLIWATQSNFIILAASMSIFALNAASWVPARNVYVAQTVEPARRGEIFGRLSAFGGILAFPASYIGGLLYDNVGFYAPFIGNLIFAVVTLVILIFFVPKPGKGEKAWQSAVATPTE
ncbi:MAG: MFS transporter [Chloroflexota bacterium]|nr:MAG: MFS transporter [Chloroflexota bacterium]